MTKKLLLLSLICLFILGVLYLLKNKSSHKAPETQLSSKEKEPLPSSPPGKISGRKVIGLKPGNEEEQIKKLNVTNQVSEEWQENLEENLRSQGGKSLSKINIKKVDSLVWVQDGLTLFAESVIISLENENNEQTTFKALVDSQSGKILKTWDRPVFDPVHPKDNFKIKLDPRYHNE